MNKWQEWGKKKKSRKQIDILEQMEIFFVFVIMLFSLCKNSAKTKKNSKNSRNSTAKIYIKINDSSKIILMSVLKVFWKRLTKGKQLHNFKVEIDFCFCVNFWLHRQYLLVIETEFKVFMWYTMIIAMNQLNKSSCACHSRCNRNV